MVRPEYAADSRFWQRFAAEGEAARWVGGFFTAPVVDAGPDDNPPWLVTAYVAGPSLQTAVREHGPLPATDLAPIRHLSDATPAMSRRPSPRRAPRSMGPRMSTFPTPARSSTTATEVGPQSRRPRARPGPGPVDPGPRRVVVPPAVLTPRAWQISSVTPATSRRRCDRGRWVAATSIPCRPWRQNSVASSGSANSTSPEARPASTSSAITRCARAKASASPNPASWNRTWCRAWLARAKSYDVATSRSIRAAVAPAAP